MRPHHVVVNFHFESEPCHCVVPRDMRQLVNPCAAQDSVFHESLVGLANRVFGIRWLVSSPQANALD